MNRLHVTLLAAGLCLAVGTAARPQMGSDFFKRPAISSLLKPVLGNGSVYETSHTGQASATKSTMEWLVVGKELADGKDAFWLEIGMHMKGFDGTVYSKALISKDDFHVHRTIMQMPGHPAMEMNVNTSSQEDQRKQDELSQWSQAGTETVIVPAGTFVCQHWKKNDGKSEVWANDQISPFGMVKEVSPTSSMVLVKVITDAKDHITGPVTQFDPQAFRQMMMDQMSSQKPN